MGPTPNRGLVISVKLSNDHVIDIVQHRGRAATIPSSQDRKNLRPNLEKEEHKTPEPVDSSCDIVSTLLTVANLAKHWRVSEIYAAICMYLRFKYLQTNHGL